MVTSLVPGLLNNLNANASCLAAPAQITSACQIGTASVTISVPAALTETGNLYLVPPQGSDIAGVEFVAMQSSTNLVSINQYIGVSFNPSQPGGLNITSALPSTVTLGTTQIPVEITQLQVSFDATLNGHPFSRMPTSCAPATSTMSVTYLNGATGQATATPFTPTGCGNLPYAPNLTAAIAADAKGGAELKTSATQAANESASKAIKIAFPPGLTPNAGALLPCLSGTACTIGTATATSPLVPGTLNGTVAIVGTALAPTLTISFPAPVNLTLTGAVSLSSNSVTFSSVPDVPLTNLSLDVTG